MNKLLFTVLLILTVIQVEPKSTETLQEMKTSVSPTEKLQINKVTSILEELQATEPTLAATQRNKTPNIKIEPRLIETNDRSNNQITVDNPSNKIDDVDTPEASNEYEDAGPIPCTCGVFLSGQFKKGSNEQPKGVPVLTQETDTPFMNNAMGNRQCTNKCLELIVKHLPKSSDIICAMADRQDIFKERAYLFIMNYSDKWIKTNMSAGREFCCKNYEPYRCPL